MDADCLSWEGVLSDKGYPLAYIEGRYRRVHREVYEAQFGELPDDWDVHHECGNRACVNPHHLEAMPKGEHTKLTIRKPICKRGHVMAETRYFNGFQTTCRECVRELRRERTARDRARRQ